MQSNILIVRVFVRTTSTAHIFMVICVVVFDNWRWHHSHHLFLFSNTKKNMAKLLRVHRFHSTGWNRFRFGECAFLMSCLAINRKHFCVFLAIYSTRKVIILFLCISGKNNVSCCYESFIDVVSKKWMLTSP